MPWLVWLLIAGYVTGWLGFVAAHAPDDALDGATLLFVGMIWPLFFLGWIVSRPFA